MNKQITLAVSTDVCELSIDEIKKRLSDGSITSTELVVSYLNRLFYYDANGIMLNSTPIINPDVLNNAMECDEQRALGKASGDLFGIPYTVKDSYMVRGMTMAAGSPAFAEVTAGEDCFSVQALRKEGAILIGRTNMPPMAAGGMQKGVYGRAENPYNGEYLAAAWYSGSSNGSAVSTASSFAAFGLGEETVSSGRSPAANNGLVAYTPSRGVISSRGNWILHATKDVVVPHTRTVSDLLNLLPALTRVDDDVRGDLWRRQSYVRLEGAEKVRWEGFSDLSSDDVLGGLRIGVIDEYAGRPGGRIPSVYIRPSINSLLLKAVDDLIQLGASVRWTNFPLRDAYEADPRTLRTFVGNGIIPKDWMRQEWLQLNASALEEFIESFDIKGLDSLTNVDPDDIFPNPFASLAYRRGRQYGFYHQAIPYIRSGKMVPSDQTPGMREGLCGLEKIRATYLERWMEQCGFDVLVFPTNSNIAHADSDVDPVHNTEAWQDGTVFSNGNRMIRHLGIPTVSVTMGIMGDTGVPAGLTFMGPSGSDRLLLACAYEYEQASRKRIAPRRTPSIEPSDRIPFPTGKSSMHGSFRASLHIEVKDGILWYEVATEHPEQRFACRLFVNGVLLHEWDANSRWCGSISVAQLFDTERIAVVALFTGVHGGVGADIRVLPGQAVRSRLNSLI